MTLCHYVGWEPRIYSKDRHAPAFCFLKYQAVAVCYYHLAILFSISPHSPFLINQDDQIEYCPRLRLSIAGCVSVYHEQQDRSRRNLPCCPKRTGKLEQLAAFSFFRSLLCPQLRRPQCDGSSGGSRSRRRRRSTTTSSGPARFLP